MRDFFGGWKIVIELWFMISIKVDLEIMCRLRYVSIVFVVSKVIGMLVCISVDKLD